MVVLKSWNLVVALITITLAWQVIATGMSNVLSSGEMKPFGNYCVSTNKCLVSWMNRTSIPCKTNRNGREYQCLELEELHKVCRGIATTTGICKK